MKLIIDPVWLAILCLLVFCIINLVQERLLLQRVTLATPMPLRRVNSARWILAFFVIVAYLWAAHLIGRS